jgi:hypothetical protein
MGLERGVLVLVLDVAPKRHNVDLPRVPLLSALKFLSGGLGFKRI